MRGILPILCAVALAGAAAAQAAWTPPASWLGQARCIHRHEGPWSANTGNGYFGGFQFSAGTWRRLGGSKQAALAHPGDPEFPFTALAAEQFYRAWLLWRRDGGSWRSWGAVGIACSG
jgi:resuscitation-promoting factor RpfA